MAHADNPSDQPTLAGKLLELQEAGISQGKAIGRADSASAAQYHRDGLRLIDEILFMVGESGRVERMPVREPR